MTRRRFVSLIISIIATIIIALAVMYQNGFLFTRLERPNCEIFHAGAALLRIEFPASLESNSYNGGIRLNKRDDPRRSNGTADPVLIIDDGGPISTETVETLLEWSSRETQGPRYEKKVLFNGLPAVLATPAADHYYYEIPFGNRLIKLQYIPDGLSSDERKVTDKMMDGIRFREVSESARSARVQNCI